MLIVFHVGLITQLVHQLIMTMDSWGLGWFKIIMAVGDLLVIYLLLCVYWISMYVAFQIPHWIPMYVEIVSVPCRSLLGCDCIYQIIKHFPSSKMITTSWTCLRQKCTLIAVRVLSLPGQPSTLLHVTRPSGFLVADRALALDAVLAIFLVALCNCVGSFATVLLRHSLWIDVC